jgi:glycosyltransferase involved in cell wall biosynthesis
MADAILRLLSDKDLCRKLKEEGLKTAQQFTWDKTADKVEKLFEQTLRRDNWLL